VKIEVNALEEDRQAFLTDVKRLKQEHAEMLEALKGIQIQ
jgi:hypothetical protein